MKDKQQEVPAGTPDHPFQNPALALADRIADLLSRMTLEEKARQLDIYSSSEFRPEGQEQASDPAARFCLDAFLGVVGSAGMGCLQNRNTSSAVNNRIQRAVLETSRLPIPVLLSEEALHGLIWPGFTIFPQQIALAGTFEPALAYAQGRAIATETRSTGVCETWSPVLDLARDPRWGRVEEGYGEDTHLASVFAREMVRGLQGDSLSAPDAIIAEVKHFTGYGAPTGGLNCAPAVFGRHEHEAYCLPVFESAFAAGAVNAMCSYNAIDNLPVACDRSLLTDWLRGKAGMPGFVRADMTAVAMLHTCHFVAETPREAIRMGIEAGVDMQLYDFAHAFYQETLCDLVRSGELPQAVLDTAVSRVLRVKFMLGLFEHPYVDETLSDRVVHTPAHVALAKEVARKAVCLLKNQGDVLPLSRDLGTIAVLGPSAAEPRFGDYTGPLEGAGVDRQAFVTVLDGIRRLAGPRTQVLHAAGCDILDTELKPVPAHWLRPVTAQACPEPDKAVQTRTEETGLTGMYFNGHGDMRTPVLTRVDQRIQFNWIYTKPGDGVDADRFSVRWTGQLVPDRSFSGTLGVGGLDSMRLWVDGVLHVDTWEKSDAASHMPFRFVAGVASDIRLEFRNDQRGAKVMFGFQEETPDLEDAVGLAARADVAVVCVGDSEDTCGENLDRADLDLPGRQAELVRRIHATGTPVVLLLQNGRPLSLVWEDEHVPAIVEAWHVGEQGGLAIAEVLFGDVNPAGRLPLSFPKHVGQLPVHYNRKPFGATRYVEMDWNPLYPFGYGLSYTRFAYSDLVLSASSIRAGETLAVSFRVTNTGERAGDEVPQLYLHDAYSSVIKPYKELAGFTRISLEPGESRVVCFELGEREMRTRTRAGEWVVEPGRFEVMVGPDAARVWLEGAFEVQP
jgi:beta-glucosidase